MTQKWAKEGKKIPPTPGFELQVTRYLVFVDLLYSPQEVDISTKNIRCISKTFLLRSV